MVERKGRKDLPLAHRGGVGVLLPRRESGDSVLFRRRQCPTRRVRLVQGELRRHHASGGHQEAKCLGIVRHARECKGILSGPIPSAILQGQPKERPACSPRYGWRLGLAGGPWWLFWHGSSSLPMCVPRLCQRE